MVRQPPLERAEGDAGGDGDDQVIGAHVGTDLVQQPGHVLRLDADQDQVGVADGRQVARRRVHAEVARQLLGPRRAGCR